MGSAETLAAASTQPVTTGGGTAEEDEYDEYDGYDDGYGDVSPTASDARAAKSILLDDRYMALLSSEAKYSSPDIALITDEDLERAANAFAHVDQARAGTLGLPEFDKLLQAIRALDGQPKPTVADVQAAFAKADVSADGRIDFNELLHFCMLHMAASLRELETALRTQ